MRRRLVAEYEAGLAGLRDLAAAVEQHSPPALRRWVARLWGIVAGLAVTFMFVGSVKDAYLDTARLVGVNLLHSQTATSSYLDERGIMLGILSEASDDLTSEQLARLARIMVDQGQRNHLDPLLLVALIMTESSFGSTQVSERGACGLMQIKPSVAQAVAGRVGLPWVCADQLLDPVENVRLGSRYLFELIRQFRDVRTALIAYNYGETELRRRLESGKRLPTGFVRRVRSNYDLLREKVGDAAPWEPVRFDAPIQ